MEIKTLCNKGDIVYTIRKRRHICESCNSVLNETESYIQEILIETINVYIGKEKSSINYNNNTPNPFSENEIGKRIFLSKEEIELKEVK